MNKLKLYLSRDRADAIAEALFSCRFPPALIILMLAAAFMLSSCGTTGTGERTTGTSAAAAATAATAAPEAEPGATATFAGSGGELTLKLAVARSEEERSRGLMYVEVLPPDTGMIFVYDRPVSDAFWMKNTYIPLSIAFISPAMEIVDIQDMEPLSLEQHTPPVPYTFAIEVNQGYFADNGITIGSVVVLEGV